MDVILEKVYTCHQTEAQAPLSEDTDGTPVKYNPIPCQISCYVLCYVYYSKQSLRVFDTLLGHRNKSYTL